MFLDSVIEINLSGAARSQRIEPRREREAFLSEKPSPILFHSAFLKNGSLTSEGSYGLWEGRFSQGNNDHQRH